MNNPAEFDEEALSAPAIYPVDACTCEEYARGTRMQFTRGYHGWRFDLIGENTRVLHKEDWNGSLTDECAGLGKVSVDTRGGWTWIKMDPEWVYCPATAVAPANRSTGA